MPVSRFLSVSLSSPLRRPQAPNFLSPASIAPLPGLVTGPRPAPASRSFPPRGHAAFRDLQRAQLDVREAGEKAGSEAGSELGKPEPGAPSEARGKGDKREVCAEFRRVPRGRRQERSPPRRSGRGDARTLGDVPGGVTGRAGVEAAPAVAATNTSGLASSACHPAALVPMRMPTALGTHALQCGTPGPAPAPCPGTASRGPWVTGPLLLQRRGHLLVPSRQICQVGGPRPVPSFALFSVGGGVCREQSALGESPKWFLVSAWSLTLFLWP